MEIIAWDIFCWVLQVMEEDSKHSHEIWLEKGLASGEGIRKWLTRGKTENNVKFYSELIKEGFILCLLCASHGAIVALWAYHDEAGHGPIPKDGEV